MNADLDTLATALYVTIDDAIVADPSLAPQGPAVGIAPLLSDAELVTLAVMQALRLADDQRHPPARQRLRLVVGRHVARGLHAC